MEVCRPVTNADIKEKETWSGDVPSGYGLRRVVCIGSCAVRVSSIPAMCTFTLGLASQYLYYNWLHFFMQGV
jgi:hypothetical protein